MFDVDGYTMYNKKPEVTEMTKNILMHENLRLRIKHFK
jgi:hypothetical protein